MINKNKRYQKGLTMDEVFPKMNGQCACGCGEILVGKRSKWASDHCRDNAFIEFSIIKGNTKIIRHEIFIRDKGFCHNCGQYDINWQVDHITPVKNGGSGCHIDKLQTLCLDCHKIKTYILFHQREISSHAAMTCCIRRLCDLGADSSWFLNISCEKHMVKSET
jgi:hypothetical protein